MRPAGRAEGGLDLGDTMAGLRAHRFAHAAMATVFEVICAHEDRGYASQAAQAAFQRLERLEMKQSRFIANSDVSRVNALEPGQATRVSPSTMECLEIARRMYDLTDRAFDIAIGSGLEGLDLIADDFIVRARTGGVRLDLGGIGKGYAVDRMAEVLDEWEIHRALVHGGFSSVVAREAPPGRDGWPVTLGAPGAGEDAVSTRISARRMALSASGTQKGAHIRDPRTGRAVGRRAAWAVLPVPSGRETGASGAWPDALRAPAAVAEAFSTAFMILSTKQIEQLCQKCPGLEAWLTERGSVDPRATEGLVHVVAAPPAPG
jgi:thiamine biosynthesis lipoprotein